MLGFVVGDAAGRPLRLLDGVGVLARLGEGDLPEGLGLISVALRDGDAAHGGHRGASCGRDGERELVIVRPLAPIEDLLDLDLALALRGVVVCELCRRYGCGVIGCYYYRNAVSAHNKAHAFGVLRRILCYGICAGHEAVNGHLVGRAVGYSDGDLAYERSVCLLRRLAFRIGNGERVRAVRQILRRLGYRRAVHRHVLRDLQAAMGGL